MILKRIEVIADDEAEIIEAVRRMSENYDFVVTRLEPHAARHTPTPYWQGNSGGIGPTSVHRT